MIRMRQGGRKERKVERGCLLEYKVESLVDAGNDGSYAERREINHLKGPGGALQSWKGRTARINGRKQGRRKEG